jgi:zinc transport system substrate-binding protein
MKQLIKNIIMLVISLVGVIAFFILWPKFHPENAKIISSNFVGYDFARAVTGDSNGVKMLIKPGTETHDYEPTPQDIIAIQQAKLFIYNCGESDAWVDKILADNNISRDKTLRLMDFVDLKTEEEKEGMEGEEEEEEEEEYDEHIWTSPKNAIRLIEAIRDKLAELEPDKSEQYVENARNYLTRIKDIDENFRSVVTAAPSKTLIFGDRFPFRYFVDEYGLDYFAAFPGCSDQTEASSSTVAFLVNKAKETNAKAIFKIELTNGQLAQTIADESGAKVYELSAAHNISQEDFEKGITYVDIMEKNVDTLKEALY